MKTLKFGYGRVSDKCQNEQRQSEALLKAGVDERNIYIDKKSGKDFACDNRLTVSFGRLQKIKAYFRQMTAF